MLLEPFLRGELIIAVQRGSAFSRRRGAVVLMTAVIAGCVVVWDWRGWDRASVAGCWSSASRRSASWSPRLISRLQSVGQAGRGVCIFFILGSYLSAFPAPFPWLMRASTILSLFGSFLAEGASNLVSPFFKRLPVSPGLARRWREFLGFFEKPRSRGRSTSSQSCFNIPADFLKYPGEEILKTPIGLGLLQWHGSCF